MGVCKVMNTVCVAEELASTASVLAIAKLELMKQPRGKPQLQLALGQRRCSAAVWPGSWKAPFVLWPCRPPENQELGVNTSKHSMARQVAGPASELPPCLVPTPALHSPGSQTHQVDLWQIENLQYGKEKRDVVLEWGTPVCHARQDVDLC